MNLFDLVVLLILVICAVTAYARGLVRSLFNLCSTVASIALSIYLYPVVCKILRESDWIFGGIHKIVINSMGLDRFFAQTLEAQTVKAQSDLIGQLSLPDFLIKPLLVNNNPEIYKLLQVTGLQDYVSSYITNIIINILSFLIVLVVVKLLLWIAVSSLDLVAKLPVLSTLNRLGGMLVGLAQGTAIIWIGFALLSLFLLKVEYASYWEMLNQSKVAIFFYKNNLILQYFLTITA